MSYWQLISIYLLSYNNIFKKMKKVLFAFVIMGFLAACSNSTETTTVDSTSCDTVKCDSMKCDSTKMVCDTAEIKK